MSDEEQKIVVEEPVAEEEVPVQEEEVIEEAPAKEVPPPREFSIKAPIDNVRIGGDALDQARRYCVTGFK